MEFKTKIDWALIRQKLPTEKNNPEQRKQRRAMFRKMDPNGNGYLSLAELDKGILDLGLDGLFNCKPAIMRSFMLAKNYGNDSGGGPGPDYVEWKEFRIFLHALKQYF